MIKAVFFDLGKVLADFNWKPAAEKIAENSAMTPDEVHALCTGSAMALEYETGKIETKLFFERLKNELNYNGSIRQLQDIWSDIFTPISKHLELLGKIHVNYPVGLISNTNEAHVEWITKKFGFLDWFPKPTYSFIAGYLKPHEKIFQDALKALSVRAEESLFIDDLEVNVLAAMKLGMRAIHLSPGKDLEKELTKFRIKGM